MTREQAIAAATAAGQPYELIDQRVNGHSLRVFKNAPPTLRALFEATASQQPFLSYQDERYTFAQAWDGAARIGQVLVHGCGVRHGDRVAIAMRNYPEWIFAFTAITSIGAVAVAMNAHWSAEEMAYALADSGTKVLLADAERLDRWAKGPATPGLQVLAVRPKKMPEGARALQALTDAVAAEPGESGEPGAVAMPAADIAPDDLATMLYTSGSTGHPKGVPSSHRNIVSALLSWELDATVAGLIAGIEAVPPAEQPGTLLAVPLFHVSGLHASYLSSYRPQRRVAAMYRWDAEAAAALVDQLRLTSVVAPSAMTGDLVRVAQAKQFDLSSLLVVGGGGAARAPEQVRQIKSSFANALPNIGWGMTETNAIGTGVGGEDYLARPSSSGRCSQVLQLRVVDELGQPLPAGQPGELLVRGTSVFAGYWNRPETNAESFIGDWFRTGDVATLDDEGFLFIVDRIKDLIIRGGENIGCGQVEAALLMHPDVQEAAVYAVPDPRLGEEVGATVYGSPSLDVAALREFLTGHLARFELPRYITVADRPLPRTPSGKILKREIKIAALAQLPQVESAAGPATGPATKAPAGPPAA
jgi:long-chain acyl-CoA synthetase